MRIDEGVVAVDPLDPSRSLSIKSSRGSERY
jgi:hypothetical protein